jgi:hypothetical protein
LGGDPEGSGTTFFAPGTSANLNAETSIINALEGALRFAV